MAKKINVYVKPEKTPKPQEKATTESNNNNKCPQGEIVRKAYSYMRKDGTRVHVPAKCVADRGLKGKGPKVLPTLKKGTLSAFGYTSKDTKAKRRKMLREAVDGIGATLIFRKLNAVMILNRNTNPKISKIFQEDRDWIKIEYMQD